MSNLERPQPNAIKMATHRVADTGCSVTAADIETLSKLKVPLPKREHERLTILRQCQLLDTAADESYDRFSTLCARYFKVPIVIISLVDVHRQWFKSRIGLEVAETCRNVAFCSYTILEETPRVMVIPDALEDSRFRTNPLVLGFPYVRFYGGASIIIDGIKVGTLCLIDSEPRAGFTKEQQEILIDIADCIAGLMIDRRAAHLENRHDNIHMHQSILSILQEPLHRMRVSASNIEALIHSMSKISDVSTNKAMGTNAERAEELVEIFQKDAAYFQKLLDTSLRSLTRVIVNPETHETMSLAGRWTPRRALEAQSNAHNKTHQQQQQQHQQLGILLPFEKLQWHIALNELLDHYRLPQASICCENDIDETMSVVSHPDLLLLCVASVLGYVAQASPNAVDAVERIHTSYVAAHSKVVVDIHSRLVSSSLVDQQESALILNSVRTVLSWVSGTLRLLPDEGIMRVEVDCELVSARGTADVVSSNGPASGQRSTRDSFVSDATYVPNGQDVDNEPLSVTPVYHPVTSSSSPQPQEQQQHKHRTMISALARNLWHAILLSSKVQPVALDTTDSVKTTPTTSSKSAMTMGLVHNKVVPEEVLSDKHSLQLLGVVPGAQ